MDGDTVGYCAVLIRPKIKLSTEEFVCRGRRIWPGLYISGNSWHCYFMCGNRLGI